MTAELWVLVEPGALEEGAVIELGRAEAHHLVTVRRRKAGRVVATDGCGHVAEAAVERDRREVRLHVGTVHQRPPVRGDVTLALGALQGQAMERAVQHSVEVGVERLIPLHTERSQLSCDVMWSRMDRWKEIGRQALKQCRRSWLLEIHEPMGLEQLVQAVPASRGLVGDPNGAAPDQVAVPQAPVLLIGPEGGLTEDEMKMLVTAGWRTVALGEFILRAPTAAAVGAAWLVARHG